MVEQGKRAVLASPVACFPGSVAVLLHFAGNGKGLFLDERGGGLLRSPDGGQVAVVRRAYPGPVDGSSWWPFVRPGERGRGWGAGWLDRPAGG